MSIDDLFVTHRINGLLQECSPSIANALSHQYEISEVIHVISQDIMAF